MKKIDFNGKIKKGSVAIYVLALMLVTAGYWSYISRETPTLETVSISENNQNTSRDEHLGDATLVSNNELIQDEIEKDKEEEEETSIETKETNAVPKKEIDDYFQESKLSRENMYSHSLETYQGMLNNSNVSEEQKSIVTQEITKLNREKNAIMICENLISTKGFENCVIFANINSVSVIVKADELSPEQIAQIQNIISREMGTEIGDIHIMTRK